MFEQIKTGSEVEEAKQSFLASLDFELSNPSELICYFEMTIKEVMEEYKKEDWTLAPDQELVEFEGSTFLIP